MVGGAEPVGRFTYERHRPEETLLYQIIEEHWPQFQQHLEQQGKYLPACVKQEFEDYLNCGRLERGVSSGPMPVVPRREACGVQLSQERFLPIMRRPMYGGGRRVDSAAHLVDEVLPERPARQWVLSVPYTLPPLSLANDSSHYTEVIGG